MAGRKGAGIQLQIEVNNDEEWEALVDKRGLIVVDVYSAWCGPCVGMVANLKKIKLEIGGDILILAIAKSDTITVLERFRERSEPCWMFISGRNIINLLIGANAPKLMKLIAVELEREKAAQRSGHPREGAHISQITQAEIERNEFERRRDEMRRAKTEEAEKQKLRERHEKDVSKLTGELKSDSVVLFLPFTYDKEISDWPTFHTLMEMLGTDLMMKEQVEVDLTVEDAQRIFNINYDEGEEDEEEEDLIDDLKEQLQKGKCLAVLIGIAGSADLAMSDTSDPALAVAAPPPADDKPAPDIDVMKVVYDAVYGAPDEDEEEEDEDEEEEGKYEEGDESPRSILAHLTEEYGWMTAIPGVWAPKTEREKAEAVIVLFREYCESIVGPPPPVLPPHVAIAFEARAYPELQETLTEYENEVIKSAFFSSHDPEVARRVADNYDELHLIARTGTEKFVVMLDNTKSEALLALAQFGPTFVSQDPEEGKADCYRFFPDEDEERMEGPLIETTDYDAASLDVTREEESTSEYDPLALRETKNQEQAEITSVVSGFEDIEEDGQQKISSVTGSPEAAPVKPEVPKTSGPDPEKVAEVKMKSEELKETPFEEEEGAEGGGAAVTGEAAAAGSEAAAGEGQATRAASGAALGSASAGASGAAPGSASAGASGATPGSASGAAAGAEEGEELEGEGEDVELAKDGDYPEALESAEETGGGEARAASGVQEVPGA